MGKRKVRSRRNRSRKVRSSMRGGTDPDPSDSLTQFFRTASSPSGEVAVPVPAAVPAAAAAPAPAVAAAPAPAVAPAPAAVSVSAPRIPLRIRVNGVDGEDNVEELKNLVKELDAEMKRLHEASSRTQQDHGTKFREIQRMCNDALGLTRAGGAAQGHFDNF
jgi:hypothetical protein